MKHLLLSLLLVGGAALALTSNAAAHPLGNFTVNRYSRIEVGPERIHLRYVLDLAEIPTLQELRSFRVPSGRVDEAARQQLLRVKASQLMSGARLEAGGHPVSWELTAASLDLLPGQADLETLRVELTLVAPWSAAESARLDYRDSNYPGRIGWHEVVARGVGSVVLAGSTAPTLDATDELRSYPNDPTRPPLDVSGARATVAFGVDSAGALQNAGVETAAGIGSEFRAPGSEGNANEELGTTNPELRGQAARRFALGTIPPEVAVLLRGDAASSLSTLGLALAIAAALGAMHGLGPGHGKTLVGAYLVGSRGTAAQALLLGLTVTATHTLGVYALGVVTLVAAQYVLPETLYPVLSLLSGLLVVAIGLSLIRSRLAAYRRARARGHDHEHHGSQHEPHVHQHDAHGGHGQGLGHSGVQQHDAQGEHSHRAGHSHIHVHRGSSGAGSPLRDVLGIGVSGGLLPCPSALVVLLAAISLNNVALGMLLVAAFSVGLASVLSAVGLLVVYGGHALGRTAVGRRLAHAPVLRAAPALSAVVITLAGLKIAADAARAFV